MEFLIQNRVWFSLKSFSNRDCEEHGTRDWSLLSNLCPRIPSQAHPEKSKLFIFWGWEML
jgi:hypothetical protein